jgi:hypothetical protein
VVACVVAFFFLLRAVIPLNSVFCDAIYPINAKVSIDSLGLLCGMDEGGSGAPVEDHQDHADCICCGSGARDALVGARIIGSNGFWVASTESSVAYFSYDDFFRLMLGWISAWSSRAPPTT